MAEIEAIIMKLNDKKSPGEDGISANIVRKLFKAAPEVVAEMYNSCLRYSCFQPVTSEQSYGPFQRVPIQT